MLIVAAKSDSAGATMIARQFADNATGVAKDQATANRLVATNQASPTALVVSSVHASSTAAATRR